MSKNEYLVTEQLFEEICNTIAKGCTIKDSCKDHGVEVSDLFKFIGKDESRLSRFTYAREIAVELMVDDILEIADDARNDYMQRFDQDENAVGYFVNGEASKRSELRINTRKWIASKLKPKRYGDSTLIKHADNEGGNLIPNIFFNVHKPDPKVESDE